MNRAVLSKGDQTKFLEQVRQTLGIGWDELSELCNVDRRTVFNWRQEQYHIPHDTLLHLSTLSRIPLPTIQEIIEEESWHSRAGKLGAEASHEKYGNPGDFESRRRGGLMTQRLRREHPELCPSNEKQIDYPELSPQLAELVGIMLGDGSIREYYATVSLNLWQEGEYAKFVLSLIESLFNISVMLHTEILKSTYTIRISSVNVVKFLDEIGLVIGNKVEQQVGVPAWIFEDDETMRACVRGLMDTDGSVYLHRYKSGGIEYGYVKLTFSNHSRTLLNDMRRMLNALGFSPATDGETKVTLNRQDEVLRYYDEIGTHNSLHTDRLQRLIENDDANFD
jgi:hypothetical protein